MRVHVEADFDIPPNTHHGRFGGVGRLPFGCPDPRRDFHGHSRRPGFGPFGLFNHNPDRYDRHHGSDHRRCCFEGSRRRCDCRECNNCDGRSEPCCCGPSSRNRRGPFYHSPEPQGPCPFQGRRQDHHFGGPFELLGRAWRGSWEWPWGGMKHRNEFNHRGPYVFNCSNDQPKNGCCDKCCKSEPCCEENKDEENENSDSKDELEAFNERENKIRMLIFSLVKELVWRTIQNNNFI